MGARVMTLKALATLHGHLTALKSLYARMEQDHIARETVRLRVVECEKAISRG